MGPDEIRSRIVQFILSEFLPGETEDALSGDILLISDGILDSMASLRLVSFLEENFNIAIGAHQMDADNLDTLDSLVALVQSNAAAR